MDGTEAKSLKPTVNSVLKIVFQGGHSCIWIEQRKVLSIHCKFYPENSILKILA
jgi:hypothetical protein